MQRNITILSFCLIALLSLFINSANAQEHKKAFRIGPRVGLSVNDMKIPNAGNYIVTFTLSNGDEYYGEFTVEN